MTATFTDLRGWPVEERVFISLCGSEGRNWGQWVDINSLQLNTWKIFLIIRISSSGNHFLGMQWCVTEVDCYLVAILKQEI